MILIRKTLAIAALVMLGMLIVAASPDGPGSVRVDRTLWLFLVPILGTICGLVLNLPWSRWLGLAAGIAVLPWAAALALGPSYGSPLFPRAALLASSLALLASLTGKQMFGRYEGRARSADWSGARMTLARWTIICNVASVLALFLFVTAYDYGIRWHFMALLTLLGGLAIGVLLLATGRTAGLMLVALCSLCFAPIGIHFVLQEAVFYGEAILFAAIFLPGILTALASAFTFGRPIWRYVASG